jgi:hypothetical protein
VKNLNTAFVYNYFVKDERKEFTANSQIQLIDTSESDTSEIVYQINAKKYDLRPRYVTIKFQPGVTDPSYFGNVTENAIQDMMKKVIIEGTNSNNTFTGIEFIDTGADKKIYTLLSSSIVFQDIASNRDSQKKLANKLHENISESGITNTENKLLLTEVLTNLQSQGVTRAQSDAYEEDVVLSRDPLTHQSFSVKFNNLFFGDIINFSTRLANTIYEDELRALGSSGLNIADAAQSAMISHGNVSAVEEAEYEMLVSPISYKSLFDPNDINSYDEAAIDELFTITKNYPKLKIIGYLIQKFEVSSSGVKTIGRIFIKNPENFSGEYKDENVRYGVSYIYKIRTVCLVEAICRVINYDGVTDIKIGKFLIASEGKIMSIDCVENIAPPPPISLKVKLNYKERKPEIIWQYPFNPQRDIKRFQIFKRASINESFTLVREYVFDNSIIKTSVAEVAQTDRIDVLEYTKTNFIDYEFDLHKDSAIYAIASVDAHGMSSGYSPQLFVKYDRINNRLIAKIISRENAPKPYPNIFIEQDFFEDAIKISRKTRCNIFFDPEYYELYRNIENNGSDEITKNKIKYYRASSTVNNEFPYSFHFINVDLQQDKTFKIKIIDKSGNGDSVPAADISRPNLNFEYGV